MNTHSGPARRSGRFRTIAAIRSRCFAVIRRVAAFGVRNIAALLSAFALTASVVLTPVLAVTREEIDALTQEATRLETEKNNLAEQIESLSGDLSSAMEQKTLLDEQISILAEQVTNQEAQIAAAEEQIAQTEIELEEARQKEAERYALFCERVRAMEENREDYRVVLFRAVSLADLLSRLDFVSEIMNADQRMMDSLREAQEEISAKIAQLGAEHAVLESARAALVDKQSELDTQRENANLLIQELEAAKSDAEISLDDLSAEEDAVQEEIIRLSRLYAQEQFELSLREGMDWYGGLTTEATLGGYAWPVYSHRINSTFGGRASPGGIGSTNHKGIDIGGVGYGTPVYASKDGLVIVSEYSSSYGNYVVVSHGAGNTTLYAHMSMRAVEVGDVVLQGDPLGTTGSTGRSTGPHLHFEIAEDGVRINPLLYLTDYYLP